MTFGGSLRSPPMYLQEHNKIKQILIISIYYHYVYFLWFMSVFHFGNLKIFWYRQWRYQSLEEGGKLKLNGELSPSPLPIMKFNHHHIPIISILRILWLKSPRRGRRSTYRPPRYPPLGIELFNNSPGDRISYFVNYYCTYLRYLNIGLCRHVTKWWLGMIRLLFKFYWLYRYIVFIF